MIGYYNIITIYLPSIILLYRTDRINKFNPHVAFTVFMSKLYTHNVKIMNIQSYTV